MSSARRWLAAATALGRLPLAAELAGFSEPADERAPVEQVLVLAEGDQGSWADLPGALVVSWSDDRLVGPDGGDVIPWQCRLVVAEPVQDEARADRLRTMAASGAAELVAVVRSLVPRPEGSREQGPPGREALAISVVKHTSLALALTAEAARELGGLRTAVANQGLRGPRVVTVAEGGPSTAAACWDALAGDAG